MKKIGLVTVLFNSDDVLEGFIKSISLQTFKNYVLYIIDNSPSIESTKLLNDLLVKYKIESFKYLVNENNVGVAKANNQGIQLSIADDTSHTLLLNNDIEFYDVNLFEAIVERAIQENEKLVIPKILFFDTKKIWMAGGSFVFYKGITNHEGEGEDDGNKFNREAYFDYAPTCFMLIDNVIFDKIGLMDEKYFVYFDDTDFLYRAYVKGFKVKYLPKLEILHKVSSSTGGSESLFSIYYGNRNRLYFIRKNFKGFQYLLAMFVTLTSRIWKYLKYDKNEKKKLRIAILDGFKI